MKIVKGFAIISFCLLLGVVMRQIIPFPIPEAVYGMVFLFIAFHFRWVKLEDVKETGDVLVSHLAFFFVAPSVALLNQLPLIQKIALPLLVIIFISTSLTMATTALTVEWLQKRRAK